MGSRSKHQGVPQPITRRQQVEALRRLKADEVAANLADKIREAVRQEVEIQLKAVRDTVLNCIDRTMDLEKMVQDWTTAEEDGPVTAAMQSATVEPANRAPVYHCNKCGYIGPDQQHEGCGYLGLLVAGVEGHHESDSADRQERAATAEVSIDDAVVREPVIEGEDDPGQETANGPTCG